MNYIDFIILILLVIFIGIGIWRGFLNEFLTFLGFVIVSFLSFIFYPFLGQKIYTEFHVSPGLANLISFISIFFFLDIIWSFLSSAIFQKIYQKWRNLSRFKVLERAFGALVGFLNGFVIVSLLLLILVVIPIKPQIKSDLSSSKLTPFFISKISFLNNKIENLFVPAADEAEAKIKNLTSYFVTEEKTELSFPKDLRLEPDSKAEQRMLDLVNAERTSRGLGQLVIDEQLSKIAREHSAEMFRLSYFDHNSPISGSPFERMNAAGISYRMAGENLAFSPNVDVAHWGLMNSPSHKANILEPGFKKIGLGIISAGSWGEMFTQDFTD